jgi:formylglycine-generating enzyme required for sulfatase activity
VRKLILFALCVSHLIALPAGARVAIQWVTVGDPGNAADDTGLGAVAYIYQVGKYEVTNAQYTEFLNAVAVTDPNGLYSVYMDLGFAAGIRRSGSPGSYTYSVKPGMGSKPVTYASFWDVLRFANWLHNGQPTGAQNNSTTEDGAYTMTPEGIEANSITRNARASIFLTSEDEWYKAAYYDAVSKSYFDYPAGTNVQTTCAMPSAAANTANCGEEVVGTVTDVGAYTGSASPAGTFDQGGNVWEWNEAIIIDPYFGGRGVQGGSYQIDAYALEAAWWRTWVGGLGPTGEFFDGGFRVARASDCDDALDNDGDGYIDYPDDPGCRMASWPFEDPACDDGVDNDGDTFVDYPDDPGCYDRAATKESPPCNDGIDNDGDGPIDLDDSDCGNAWSANERSGCGLGFELALVLPSLMWLRGRWRRRLA